MAILTADEHKANISKSQAKLAKEKRDNARAMHLQKVSMRVRDDMLAHIKNNGGYDRSSENGGPTLVTYLNWESDKVKRPHLTSLVAAAESIGMELTIIPRKTKDH